MQMGVDDGEPTPVLFVDGHGLEALAPEELALRDALRIPAESETLEATRPDRSPGEHHQTAARGLRRLGDLEARSQCSFPKPRPHLVGPGLLDQQDVEVQTEETRGESAHPRGEVLREGLGQSPDIEGTDGRAHATSPSPVSTVGLRLPLLRMESRVARTAPWQTPDPARARTHRPLRPLHDRLPAACSVPPTFRGNVLPRDGRRLPEKRPSHSLPDATAGLHLPAVRPPGPLPARPSGPLPARPSARSPALRSARASCTGHGQQRGLCGRRARLDAPSLWSRRPPLQRVETRK